MTEAQTFQQANFSDFRSTDWVIVFSFFVEYIIVDYVSVLVTGHDSGTFTTWYTIFEDVLS